MAPVAPSHDDLAGAEHRRQPDDGRRGGVEEARLLAQPLRERVRVGRRVERGPDRGRVDEAAAVLQAALEEVQRRAGVLANGAGGIGARARGIRDAGEVKDRVGAREQLACSRVSRIDPNRLRGSGALGAAGPGNPDDLVPAGLEELGRAATRGTPSRRSRRPSCPQVLLDPVAVVVRRGDGERRLVAAAPRRGRAARRRPR